MKFQIGDIGISLNEWPGHVMMCYSGGDEYSDKTIIIHANNANNFHKVTQMFERDGSIGYMFDSDRHWIFRPPWGHLAPELAAQRMRELQAVADAIAHSATYGGYRAFRLFVGDSSFGAGARERLEKYKGRRALVLAGGAPGKFVTKVSCAEAVILAYQIIFSEQDKPFFINKDAAHTMPGTLKDWLEANWETVSRGKV